jgi:hypothetical protein
MARPVAHITTPRPSFEEMARQLEIPEAREKELRVLVKNFIKKRRTQKRNSQRSPSRRQEKTKNAAAAD